MTVAAPIRPHQPSIRRDHRSALPAYPHAVAEARRQVRAAVRYWRLPVDIDAATVCTSELVTNAVTHDGALSASPASPDGLASSDGPADPDTSGDAAAIVLCVTAGDGRLRVEVYDSCPLPPALNDHVSAFAEGGRGLQLVDSLASGWGYYPTASGKAVYFTLDFADE
jgi:hypothetical protein